MRVREFNFPPRAAESACAQPTAPGLEIFVAAGGVTVTFRGGSSDRTSTFELTEQDSGTTESLITCRAYPGEEVRITGGRSMAGDGFIPATTKSIGARLNPDARAQIVQYELGGSANERPLPPVYDKRFTFQFSGDRPATWAST